MDALIRRLLSVSWASGTAGASVTPCSGWMRRRGRAGVRTREARENDMMIVRAYGG